MKSDLVMDRPITKKVIRKIKKLLANGILQFIQCDGMTVTLECHCNIIL